MMTTGVESLLAFASTQLSQGNPFQAIETLKQALAQDPDHAESHALLALCLLRVRRIDAAAHEARLSLAKDPLLPLAHYVQGSVLLGQRKFAEAERSYDTLLELEPEDPENHRAMARFLRLKGKKAEAEERLNKALELAPDDPTTLAELGEMRLSAGDINRADRLADEALRIQPEHLDALVLRGSVALSHGDQVTDELVSRAVVALQRMDRLDRYGSSDHGAAGCVRALSPGHDLGRAVGPPRVGAGHSGGLAGNLRLHLGWAGYFRALPQTRAGQCRFEAGLLILAQHPDYG
jgi:tetratricopeptide (TPR) repeat protein